MKFLKFATVTNPKGENKVLFHDMSYKNPETLLKIDI